MSSTGRSGDGKYVKRKKSMNSDWQTKLMTALRVVLAIHVASGFAQAVSAGLFISGRDAAVGFHGGIAKFMMISGAIFLAEVVQVGTGFTKAYSVHVPLAVGIILGLVRLSSSLRSARPVAQGVSS